MTDDGLLIELASLLERMPDEALERLEREAPRELERRAATRKLETYRPYPKQMEFHAAGKVYRERLLMAGNQVGKTIAAGAEVAMHLTHRYPDWWSGHVTPKPEPWWATGVTSESTRDNPQRILMGRIGAWGTGMIPKDAIKDINPRRGVADAIDTVIARWGGRLFRGAQKGSSCQSVNSAKSSRSPASDCPKITLSNGKQSGAVRKSYDAEQGKREGESK